MISSPIVNEFTLEISSVADGTRPAAAWGTSVTPAQNSYGSYAQLISGASVTDECQELEIEINTVGISAAARDSIVTIGFDLAGGTSYTDKIVDLVCGPANPHAGNGQTSVTYVFPLRVPAGCSIAAKASVNSATLTAIRVSCKLRGRPTHPELIWVGQKVTTFGSTPASSNGTSITPGTTSEGSWTQIGSALTETIYFWEFGYGVNSSTMTANVIDVDIGIGDASNKRPVIRNAFIGTNNAEGLSKAPGQGRYAIGVTGDIVYARCQVGPSAADSNNSIAVYGVS